VIGGTQVSGGRAGPSGVWSAACFFVSDQCAVECDRRRSRLVGDCLWAPDCGRDGRGEWVGCSAALMGIADLSLLGG